MRLARSDDGGDTVATTPQAAARAAPAPAGLAQRVWRDNRRWVAAVLLAHKPRSADLDDLLQTVAMAVVKKVEEVRGGEEVIKPWLRTIAVNAARAAGRKAVVRQRGLRLVRDREADRPRAVVASDAALALNEEGQRLMDLALKLPEKYREPLLLRCVQGMSYRQIGEVTGLPETTIETRIARARRMLREAAAEADAVGVSGDAR